MKKREKQATTMAELMVVLAIFTLLGLAVFMVVSRGMDFYRDSETIIEVRKQSLLGISRLSRELAESNLATMNAANLAPDFGIVFCSPRDLQGEIKPTQDGKLAWVTWICYYTDIMMIQGKPVTCLFRKDQPLPNLPRMLRPPDPLNCINLTPPQPNRTPMYFKVLARSKRLMCKNVETFAVIADVDSVDLRLTCKLSARYKYTSTLRTKVVPRF